MDNKNLAKNKIINMGGKSKSNKLISLAVKQNLLLWEISRSTIEIERQISKTIEAEQAKSNKINEKDSDFEN